MNILILGALPETEDDKKLYTAIIEACKGHDVSSPIDTANFEGDERATYDRAFQKVKEADLIIGEQSKPSTGQGMEIREAAILNKPVIVVAREGSKVSGLVKGCPVVKEIIYYNDIEDMKNQLTKAL